MARAAFNPPGCISSIFRDHGTAELEIDAGRDGGIGRFRRVRNLSVRRQRMAGAVIAVEIGVTVLELPDDMIGQRIGDAATGGQAIGLDVEPIDDIRKAGIFWRPMPALWSPMTACSTRYGATASERTFN
ncbi:MAG TPA: hypothetical protein VKT76_07545, partial [Bradyrhizobium sp.]|nr:hypothetical protein [Bradyrhizobium sp.]